MMYLQHFGLDASPFKISPHTELFFEGAKRGAILDALVYAVTGGEGLVKVTGEVGSGKTMLCRMLAERLPPTVETIYLAVPSLRRDEILHAIAHDLGVPVRDMNTTGLLRELQTKLIELHAQGRRVVVLIDEAHAMPLDSLEEIRLLSNLETNQNKLLQIVLFGQPELNINLALQHMRQLKERITHSFELPPLTEQEVGQYMNFRLRACGYRGPELFKPDCVKLIARASQGLTRRVNILADKTLLAAYANSTHDVQLGHAKAALHDSEFSAPGRPPILTRVRVVTLAFGVILGALLYAVFNHFTQRAPSPAPNLGQRATVSVAQAPALPAAPTPAPVTLPQAEPLPPVHSVAAPAPVPSPAPAAASSAAEPKPALDPAPATLAAPTVEVAAAVPAAVVNPEPQPAASEPWQTSQQWMRAQAAQHWVIQLMLADFGQRQQLHAFVQAATQQLSAAQVHQYPLWVNGVKKIGVLYGSFGDRRAASAALAGLPHALKQHQPYLRTIAVVRKEVAYDN